MKYQAFFTQKPVFTIDEFRAQGDGESFSTTALEAALAYYTKIGRIKRIRRGLYLTIPVGTSPESEQADPFLLAGKMADDAIVAYQTALALFGKSYSLQSKYYFCSHKKVSKFSFQGAEYIGIQYPKALVNLHQEGYSTQSVERSGLNIRVTSLERTFVDVLDRPKYGRSWEEVWRSLEMIEYVDLDQVVEYAFLLDNATTIAKVGWFLEQYRDALMVDEQYLQRLAERRPRKPHYLDRSHKETSRMVARWNLLVPQSLYDRSWEEPF